MDPPVTGFGLKHVCSLVHSAIHIFKGMSKSRESVLLCKQNKEKMKRRGETSKAEGKQMCILKQVNIN